MANWPNYTFELIGSSKNSEKLKSIVDILVNQTPEEHVEWNNYKSFIKVVVHGTTAWGLRDVDKIDKKIEENKLSARFWHSDPYNDTYITMWNQGKIVFDENMNYWPLFMEEDKDDKAIEFLNVWNDPKEWKKIMQNHISNIEQEYQEESSKSLNELLEKIRNGEEIPGLERFEAPE